MDACTHSLPSKGLGKFRGYSIANRNPRSPNNHQHPSPCVVVNLLPVVSVSIPCLNMEDSMYFEEVDFPWTCFPVRASLVTLTLSH